ncbi:hypothetical protein D3C75_1382820 [compost metagenome]
MVVKMSCLVGYRKLILMFEGGGNLTITNQIMEQSGYKTIGIGQIERSIIVRKLVVPGGRGSG